MPEPIFMRQMVLLAKLEATYGVDPTLTGVANAILAKNVTARPMEGQDVSRELIVPYLGAQPSVPAGLHSVLEFEVELAGSGEAGTAPAWGPLLRACACAEVIEADASVTYNPITELMESVYLKYWLGTTLHAIKGARGNAELTVNAQGIPVIRFTFTGLYVPPVDIARAVPTFTAFQDPLIANSTNTPAFAINSVALVLRSWSFKFGNQVEPRLLIGREAIVISNRAETLDIVVEHVPLATLNPQALANAQTRVPATLTHGTVAGNIITINAPTAQMKRPAGYQENQGVAERALSLAPLPSAGNDQFTITLT